MFCSQCGVENPDNGKFCTACGASLGEETPVQSNQQQLGVTPAVPRYQPAMQQYQPTMQQYQSAGYGYNEYGNVITPEDLASAKNLGVISTILFGISVLMISPILIPITAVARSRFITAQKKNTKEEFEADMKSGKKFLLAAVIIFVLVVLLMMWAYS